jgi:hypothetical protein
MDIHLRAAVTDVRRGPNDEIELVDGDSYISIHGDQEALVRLLREMAKLIFYRLVLDHSAAIKANVMAEYIAEADDPHYTDYIARGTEIVSDANDAIVNRTWA